jgi:hypothetical protein
MSKPIAPVNPCPRPHLPPIKFELQDFLATFPIMDLDEQKDYADRALSAYWAQAANMTKADQEAYIRLLKNGSFVVPKNAIVDPCNHPLYEELSTEPSWPKYVMLKAIYDSEFYDSKNLGQKTMVKLEIELQPVFGSLAIRDLTWIYRHEHLAKRKREEESDADDDDEDIPRRIVKKQSPEHTSAERTTATTTRAQRTQIGTQRVATLNSMISPLSTRSARNITLKKALYDQNTLLKMRCNALESTVADLQRKIEASHLNVIVLLTTILEKVGQSGDGIDEIRRELGF